MQAPKIALAHHWLTSPGGAEKVLYELHLMYPDAPIFTTSYLPEKFPEFANADVRTTFLDKLPYIRRHHQLYPVFLGLPMKTHDLSQYDLVISSCAAEGKYIKTSDQTLHICYCHTPIRYYWSDYDWMLKHMPFGKLNTVAGIIFRVLVGRLRSIDFTAAQHVDLFIANSRHISARIRTYYQRESTIIYPPISTKRLLDLPRVPQDYYLIVGRQVASKRLDVAIDAFNELGLPLKIAGAGEEVAKQAPRARANITFLGRVSDVERDELMSGAKAFIFPPEEDFGIAPLEAMAAGCPVIAFGQGGAPEYVLDGITGVTFADQTPTDLMAAVRRFETLKFDEKVIRTKAQEFDTEVFRLKLTDFVEKAYARFLSTGKAGTRR